MLKTIIYYIGKRSKAFRQWYYKKSGHKYPWGLFQFIKDLPPPTEPLTEKTIVKMWDDINLI